MQRQREHMIASGFSPTCGDVVCWRSGNSTMILGGFVSLLQLLSHLRNDRASGDGKYKGGRNCSKDVRRSSGANS